jgi:MoaA/NifB/PqqE/SkfB family radical SAM enzyme
MPSVQDYLKKIPQYTRMSRHARAVIQHGTPRKWANLALIETERMMRRIEVRGRPYILFLDPCNYCNLRCPLCPTGMNKLGRQQSIMSFDCFKTYLDPHVPYLFELNLHNWGESMINRDLYKMIDYAASRNIGTNLSSNLMIAQPSDLDGLLDSGLEYLTISLDGADQESYVKYRVRGEFDRVIANLSDLIRRRAARKRSKLFIEWQYIVMKHNEHKVEEARALADRLGVDLIRFIPVGLPFEARNRKELGDEWFPTAFEGMNKTGEPDQIFGQNERPSPCYYLYRSMVVNADGGVSPCCIVYKESRDFDDLKQHKAISIGEIYNNEKFKSARSLYSAKALPDRPKTICDGCDLFARHPSKLLKRPAPAPAAEAVSGER